MQIDALLSETGGLVPRPPTFPLAYVNVVFNVNEANKCGSMSVLVEWVGALKSVREDGGDNENYCTTVDGRNIQTLSTTWTPSTQSSMLEVLQECFGEWTKQIKPWKHKFNQVMFNIDLWGSGVGDSYWYMGLNIWSIYCLKV